MKYSVVSATALLAGWTMANRPGGATLHGAMTDAIDAARTLHTVVCNYKGGDAEDVECAINTAVVLMREATDQARGFQGTLSSEDAQSFDALGQVGGDLVNGFGDKIPIFNDARICNSVTTHVTDLDDQVTALFKAVGSKMPSDKAATSSKTQSTFTELKDSMDTCNACGVIGDDSHNGAPLGFGGNGTTSKYPGPVGTNAGTTTSASCGAVLLAAIAAVLI
ncbi:uncharacterized protein PG998_010274 [Apiospora kogelbergensis]|uniref:uncharacterized protein n=1 Tax=Apiospora kogelbergensis TaxID=1337665 RepID=UPI00312F4032